MPGYELTRSPQMVTNFGRGSKRLIFSMALLKVSEVVLDLVKVFLPDLILTTVVPHTQLSISHLDKGKDFRLRVLFFSKTRELAVSSLKDGHFGTEEISPKWVDY